MNFEFTEFQSLDLQFACELVELWAAAGLVIPDDYYL